MTDPTATPIHIDLDTRILSDRHQVFVARPGKSFRLYASVVESKAVVLELPALDLLDGVELANDRDLMLRVARSKAIRSWHRQGRPDGERPSSDLSEYLTRTAGASVAQLGGLVRGLFERAQQGDLVIVPPKSFLSDAFIGEFIDPPSQSVIVKSERFYPGDPLPGRRVRWLAQIPKRKLSPSILQALEHPVVYFNLERSLRGDIYNVAYPSFIIDNDSFSARFNVKSTDFTSRDDFFLQAFFNFVAANSKAIDEGRTGDVQGVETAAFQNTGDYDLDLRSNINSPGFLILLSRYPTPLIAATLFALAVEVGPGAAAAAENGLITLQNSRATQDDNCSATVHNQVVRHLQLLSLDKWPKACEFAREVSRRTGTKGPVKVR